MAVSANPESSLDPISRSDRDQAAEERDGQAEGRDVAAQARDDLVPRVGGGDEFVSARPGRSADQVHSRYGLALRHLAEDSADGEMTVGLATLRAGDSLDGLIDRADQAMFADRR